MTKKTSRLQVGSNYSDPVAIHLKENATYSSNMRLDMNEPMDSCLKLCRHPTAVMYW